MKGANVFVTCGNNMKDAGSCPLLVSDHVVRPAEQSPELHVRVRCIAKQGVYCTRGHCYI